jgi:hypothetical protein
MIVTGYEVGPGAYGVALGADGAAWTSLTRPCGLPAPPSGSTSTAASPRRSASSPGLNPTGSRSARTVRYGSRWKRAPSST